MHHKWQEIIDSASKTSNKKIGGDQLQNKEESHWELKEDSNVWIWSDQTVGIVCWDVSSSWRIEGNDTCNFMIKLQEVTDNFQ